MISEFGKKNQGFKVQKSEGKCMKKILKAAAGISVIGAILFGIKVLWDKYQAGEI